MSSSFVAYAFNLAVTNVQEHSSSMNLFMKKSVFICLGLALIMLSGCATNAMTGRSQLSLVSESSAIAQSSKLYSSMIDGYSKKGKVSTDPVLNERVQKITNRLVEQAILYRPDSQSWKWQVSVIEDDTTNASCMPGGKMVVFTGLVNKLQPTDDELAQVMGHEISHALANHGAEKMSVSMMTNAAVALVTVAVAASGGGDTSGYQRRQRQDATAGAAGLAAAAFITLPNSREAESEADKLGIELAARAGYEPGAAVTLWKKMMEVNGQKSSSDFMSTHPSPPNRIAALEALQGPMNIIYEERKPVYANYTPAYQYVKVDAKAAVAAGGDPILNSSNVRVVEEANAPDPILSAPNVRVIEDPSSPNTLAPAATPPKVDAGKAMVFYSPKFEAFKQGKLAMACTDCSFKFYLNQNDLKKHYANKDWRLLAQTVIKTDYQLDLSYFYLAAAADGMGFGEAAKAYSSRAIELAATEQYACGKAKMIKCDHVDVTVLPQASN